MDSTSTEIKEQVSNLLIQPFPIQFDCNDFHIIAFFEGHPEYESIEAMIQERDGKEPYIRAIITSHNKIQTDYVNDRKILEKVKGINSRKIYYTPITYLRKRIFFKKHIVLKFTSFKKENIVLDFYPASKPSAKHANLIDPLGHSINTSLPVMYPVKSTLLGSKSKVLINNTKYIIPVKIHVPVFFTGLKGFYSEMFNIGIIRAGNKSLALAKYPAELKEGEKWIYKSDKETFVYEITGIEDSNITCKSRNEKVELEITESGLALKDISVYSSSKSYRNAVFTIHFNPSIVIQPAFMDNIMKGNTHFSISINEYSALVTGTLEAEAGNESVKLYLKPVEPDWATERNVAISVKASGNYFYINTDVIKE